MRFAEDLKLASGALLIPRGQEVTPALIARLRMLRPGTIKASIRVAIPLKLMAAAAAAR
jgi:hypothetical protein